MSENRTTSIRLNPRLRQALERRAKAERRGKNWVICRALERYLGEDDVDWAGEARRQSILASREENADWAEDADLSAWK